MPPAPGWETVAVTVAPGAGVTVTVLELEVDEDSEVVVELVEDRVLVVDVLSSSIVVVVVRVVVRLVVDVKSSSSDAVVNWVKSDELLPLLPLLLSQSSPMSQQYPSDVHVPKSGQ